MATVIANELTHIVTVMVNELLNVVTVMANGLLQMVIVNELPHTVCEDQWTTTHSHMMTYELLLHMANVVAMVTMMANENQEIIVMPH